MNFQDAVSHAKRSLAPVVELPSEAERLAALILHFCQEGDGASLQSIVNTSGSQLLSYEALGLAAASLLETDERLPAVLERWVLDVLRGTVVRPPMPKIAKSGWPGANNERDLMIFDAVKDLQKKGLTPSRNAMSPHTSGCDAVSEAMGLLGYPRLSYGTVKKIYEGVGRKIKAGGNPRLGVEISNRLRRSTSL
ncbi:hypothetical protein [Leisingera caerulea]|uniref:Uncharacterized protein n=1 Tax=Leisingera caerulea TaxID=506591 RepID=A0A9Q9HHV6_LEICA|nr:hypothetical protein [Leisingera caerulea]UWQ54993.1 hypothetical protein K3721_05520 [Leisingera caerulea]